MSSTNRSNARAEHIADYYVTPQSHIRNFFATFLADEDIQRPDKMRTLDPCAGGDAHHTMSYPAVLEEFGIYPKTIDIREDSIAELHDDYLNVECTDFDLIITNPPFNKAQMIIEKALNDVSVGGYVVMLLRLNYFGSKQRFQFWKNNMPKYAYVHHTRMAFTDNGKTDSIEYMHCVWQKGYKTDSTILKII